MKILHLIDSGGLYGAEVMLISLASEQKKMGQQPVIGSIRIPGLPEKPLERAARKRALDVREFPMHPGINIPGALRILQYSRNHGFDILHSHGYKTNILLGMLPGWLRRLPIISTVHGWTSTGGWTKMRINEELDALSLRFVDRIVLVNQGMLEKKKVQSLPAEKVRVINNGIEIESETLSGKVSAHENMRAFCDRGTVIASIGRLSTEKGFSHLIEAVQLLRTEYAEDVRLLLIGDGRLRDELQCQADASGLHDFFLITGYLNNARDLLGKVDVYVISSLTEGLPITLLEAMVSRTPVVASAVGGIPHVLENDKEGLLVQPKNARDLALAICRLLQDPALKERLVEKAYTKVVEEYSSRKMAESYSRLYCEILRG